MITNRKQHGWSFADDRHLIELAASSMSLDDMAAIMKRGVKALERRAKRLGLSIARSGSNSGIKTSSQKRRKNGPSVRNGVPQ
jgi:hypothetical protein